jgi:hypothetical protein
MLSMFHAPHFIFRPCYVPRLHPLAWNWLSLHTNLCHVAVTYGRREPALSSRTYDVAYAERTPALVPQVNSQSLKTRDDSVTSTMCHHRQDLRSPIHVHKVIGVIRKRGVRGCNHDEQ